MVSDFLKELFAYDTHSELSQEIEKLERLDEEFAPIPGYNAQIAAGHGSARA